MTLALASSWTLAPLSHAELTKKVGEDLYAYVSDNDFSANAVFLATADGVLVVDTGFDGNEATRLLSEIRKVSDSPVRFIVNTHYHRDHQAGNGLIGPDAVVISTAWTRRRTEWFLESVVPRLHKELEGPALESLRSTRFRPAVLTIDEEVKVHLGAYEVKVYHPGKAHTSGDVLVYFPAQRVMAMGDLFLTNSSPAMDEGSVWNWIGTLTEILEGPAKTFVPGHFELATKRELERFRDYLSHLYDRVRILVASSATLEEVRERIRADPYADFRQHPRFRATFADNAEVIYREITEAQRW